ncbi:uncharacterized protein LOC129762347 [Toxorhynchites rutilus septentrionalis]|uniref:uncharacterized protein LOC129762347 n=1 Tax=Toxorhynchites rutilus septentrionalis TaxID=329112 RepID=UPI00247B2840|nr:uncharacterized protein LOC129762347 [Toxorhynchites rutilus septentrionalis]
MYSDMVSVALYCLLPPLVTVVKYALGTGPILVTVYTADYLLFDIGAYFWLWLPVTSFTILMTFYMAFGIVTTDSFNLCILHHITCLFKVVRMKLNRLDDFKETDLYRQKLVDIILLQEVGYRSTKRMERVLNGMLLMLYIGCIVCLCLIMMVLTIAKGDRELLIQMTIVLLYNLLIVFSYSMLGTELMDASVSIANAAYTTRWYDRTIPIQKAILIIMTRSQNQVALTAGKLFLVNRASFAMALRDAYSYYTVLGKFYDT